MKGSRRISVAAASCLIGAATALTGVGLSPHAQAATGALPQSNASALKPSLSVLPQVFAVHWNVQAVTKDLNAKRLGKVMNRLTHFYADGVPGKASVYGLTEASPKHAAKIAKKLGKNYDYFPKAKTPQARFQTVIWDKNTWKFAGGKAYKFSKKSDRIHGFVNVRLQNRGTSEVINVLEFHLEEPQNAEGSEWNKQNARVAQWKQISKFTSGQRVPTLLMGDTNWHTGSKKSMKTNKIGANANVNSPFENYAARFGQKSTRTSAVLRFNANVETLSKFKVGGVAYDFALTTRNLYAAQYLLLPGTGKWGSDHHMITVQLMT